MLKRLSRTHTLLTHLRPFLIVLLVLLFLGNSNIKGDPTASVKIYSLGVDLGPASAIYYGNYLVSYFTTYDGQSTLPLFDTYGNTIYVSGELSPVLNNPGLYVTDYGLQANNVWDSYGTAAVTFPTTDADQNGVPDFLQSELSSSVSFSGTVTAQSPTTGTSSVNGTLSRSTGSSLGTYRAVISNPRQSITYTGNTHILNAKGSLTYKRSPVNQGTFQVTITDSEGTSTAYTATTSFNVISKDSIQFPSVSFASTTSRRVVTKEFTLLRTGKRYKTQVDLIDGNPLTSWLDYTKWVIVIDDTNDSNGNGIPDLSDALTTPVLSPTITSQPQSASVTTGQPVTLTVTATGTSPISYQWLKNGLAIPGATSAAFTINSTTSSDAGIYSVSITNPGGSITSANANLVVNAQVTAPTITVQPKDISAKVGGSAAFAVSAIGTAPLTFQWRKNSLDIPGATLPNYSLNNLETTDAGSYSIRISNAAGSINSNPATLQIIQVTPPSFSKPSWNPQSKFSTTLQGQPQTGYSIQYSSDLIHWFDLTNVTSLTAMNQILDQPPTTVPFRFYRAYVNNGNSNQTPGNPHPSYLVWIPQGTFTMGSASTEANRQPNEGPQTQVTISKGFWISSHETTQEEYMAIMGSNPSAFTGDLKRPVEQVSWHDATNYCGKLTAADRALGILPTGYIYRLPTEAEWEYACRAGTSTRFSFGDDIGYTKLPDFAWFASNSAGKTHSIEGKSANTSGIFNMSGNVWEWCSDWFGAYPGGSVTDPKGPATGGYRIYRGGSFFDAGSLCRSAARYSYLAEFKDYRIGFRPVLAPSQ